MVRGRGDLTRGTQPPPQSQPRAPAQNLARLRVHSWSASCCCIYNHSCAIKDSILAVHVVVRSQRRCAAFAAVPPHPDTLCEWSPAGQLRLPPILEAALAPVAAKMMAGRPAPCQAWCSPANASSW